jgi:FHA domain
VDPTNISVESLFTILRRSVDEARTVLGTDHVLIPLEPWQTPQVPRDYSPGTVTQTRTRRAHLMMTSAGQQVPVLQAACYPLKRDGKGDGTLFVGRTAKAAVLVEQPTVSRHHADFTFDRGALHLIDRGSYNGTMINDRVLDQGEAVALKAGDLVVFGEAQLMYGSLEHIAVLLGGSAVP